MPRRASSGINAGILIGVAVFVIVALIAGKLLIGRKSTSLGDVPVLDIGEFLKNGNSMRGNEYKIEGEVDEQLRWTSDRGRVISLKVEENNQTEMIWILIPAEFNDLNIEHELRYAFRVRVGQGGKPVATGVERL